MSPERPWHCAQIPNPVSPIVVCQRADLLAEIETLRYCDHVEDWDESPSTCFEMRLFMNLQAETLAAMEDSDES
jgi:hypothetical protein